MALFSIVTLKCKFFFRQRRTITNKLAPTRCASYVLVMRIVFFFHCSLAKRFADFMSSIIFLVFICCAQNICGMLFLMNLVCKRKEYGLICPCPYHSYNLISLLYLTRVWNISLQSYCTSY